MSVSVVIPVKDRLDLTRAVVENLRAMRGYDEILIFDNGSQDGTDLWLERQPDLWWLSCPGWNLHTMWNTGRRLATGTHVAILNNDISFDEGFLQGLRLAFDLHENIAVTCPNPEGNPLSDEVNTIGCITGFAFMLRNTPDVPAFDERFKWYWGDLDFSEAVKAKGLFIAQVESVRVRHIGGASTPEGLVDATRDHDSALYNAKWGG